MFVTGGAIMNNILVVGTKSSFLIKGLISRLEDSGYSALFSPIGSNDLEKKLKRLILLFSIWMRQSIIR